MNNDSANSSEFNIEMWTNFLVTSMQYTCYSKSHIYITYMISIFVISLCGNLLTCIVIYTDKSMHTVTNYYLFNLAASDLMLTFAILTEIYGNLSYDYSKQLCLMQWFFVVCLWNNSILTMTALSIERYIAIWHPMFLNSSSICRRVAKVIGLLWLLAVAEAAPELLTVDVVRTSRTAVCFTVPTPLARVLNGVLAILTFVLPLVIMTFVYSTIVFKVNRGRKKYFRDKIFNHRDPRRKINGLMIAMTVCFFVCWTPFFVVRVLICLLQVDRLIQFPQWWSISLQVVNINTWLSIVVNPVLFNLASRKFRRSLKSLWKSKIKRTSSSDGNKCS